MKLIIRIVLIFFLSAPSFQTIYTVQKKDLKAIHSALFNLFLPNESSFNTTEAQQRSDSFIQSWKAIKHSQLLQSFLQKLAPKAMLFPLDIEQRFPKLCKHGFIHGSLQEQEAFLFALRRHEDTTLRYYVSQLRLMYIYMIYSDVLCDELSQVTVTNFPPNPVDLHLAESKLRIENNTIVHSDGPIDYLIIGSGPAGCLVAHELARLTSNLRIVVVEAGSFVKPQSVITELSDELMESHNQRTTVTGGIVFRNGWTVGGGSAVNIDLAFSPLLPNIQETIQE